MSKVRIKARELSVIRQRLPNLIGLRAGCGEKVIFGWRRHLSRPVVDAISAPDCMDRPRHRRIGHGIPKVARDGGGDHDHARQSGDDTA